MEIEKTNEAQSCGACEKRNLGETEIFEKLDALVKKLRAEIQEFEYHKGEFCDIILTVMHYDKTYKFEVKRDEIYCNSRSICQIDYKENETALSKLIEIIYDLLY